MENETQDGGERSAKQSKISKKTMIIVVAVIVVIALAFYFKGSFIAATVNGSMISKSSLIKQLEKQAGKLALDNLVIEKLIDQEAKKLNINIKSEDVDAQIKLIEDQLKTQNTTLELALKAQGLTRNDLKKQITTQKKLELLLADKITVSDEEVAKFISDNNATAPAGQEAQFMAEARLQVSQQKLNAAAQTWIAEAKTKAKINYYVSY